MAQPVMERPVAVITGASSGFGEQTARNLATEGWLTIGVARRGDRLETLATELDGEYHVCDVSEWGSVSKTAEEILDRHPRINLLVNNAGEALRGRILDAGDSREAEDVMYTNFFGSLWMTNALMRGLMAATPSADIVNMVSAAATVTNPKSGLYAASKSAQLAFSRSLTADLRPHGIRVHAILPGKADTEGHPQTKSSSPLSGIFGTDVDTVARAVVARVGKRPKEVYVPKVLKGVAILDAAAPAPVTRIIDKMIS